MMSLVKIEAHGFSRTVSGAKQTKMKSPLHPAKIAVCEQNFKIATNFVPKTQTQPEKNAPCEQALSHVSNIKKMSIVKNSNVWTMKEVYKN